MGHAMGYPVVRVMQEVAPLHCGLTAGEESPNNLGRGVSRACGVGKMGWFMV